MSDDEFWSLISIFDWSAEEDDGVIQPVVDALAPKSEAEILAFEDSLAAKLFALDTREHARFMFLDTADPDDGDQYISPDQFLYSRCFVIAQGRKWFDTILAHPDGAPQGEEFETLLYVASEAFEKKTGKELDHAPPHSVESFSNKEGWKPTAKTRPGKYTEPNSRMANTRPG